MSDRNYDMLDVTISVKSKLYKLQSDVNNFLYGFNIDLDILKQKLEECNDDSIKKVFKQQDVQNVCNKLQLIHDKVKEIEQKIHG